MEEDSGISVRATDIQLVWPSPPPLVELAEDEVHVWSACLGRAAAEDPARLAMLSEDERARAAQFHFERDRKDFVARRSLLRAILGHYLKVEPPQVSLAYEERGKPRLAGPDSPAPLHFNFSHSRGLALCAVSRSAPLGVDVEKLRPMPEMAEIGVMFSSAQENARLNAAPPEERLEVFFRLWTRKEAYLKATGEGIAGSLAQLDCAEAPPGWSFHALSPAPGFVGALACACAPAKPLCWQWAWKQP